MNLSVAQTEIKSDYIDLVPSGPAPSSTLYTLIIQHYIGRTIDFSSRPELPKRTPRKDGPERDVQGCGDSEVSVAALRSCSRDDGLEGGGKAPERLRGDYVHGDDEGLRFLRGHTCHAQIARQAGRGRRSRRHCLPRRSSPMGPSSVSLSSNRPLSLPFPLFACNFRAAPFLSCTICLSLTYAGVDLCCWLASSCPKKDKTISYSVVQTKSLVIMLMILVGCPHKAETDVAPNCFIFQLSLAIRVGKKSSGSVPICLIILLIQCCQCKVNLLLLVSFEVFQDNWCFHVISESRHSRLKLKLLR